MRFLNCDLGNLDCDLRELDFGIVDVSLSCCSCLPFALIRLMSPDACDHAIGCANVLAFLFSCSCLGSRRMLGASIFRDALSCVSVSDN